MRIGHISDLHYCPRYLDEADRCTAAAIETMLEAGVDVIAITGDGYDHQLDANQPAFLALCRRLRAAADHVPILYLQGTFSHDFPGTVRIFRLLGGRYPIHVSDRIEHIAWDGERFTPSDDWRFDELPHDTRALFSCLPSINRGDIAAKLGIEATALQTREVVAELLRSFASINEAARRGGIPTAFLSHGTVTGAITEHGVPMAGWDHEFSLQALRDSQASACLLGHIHRRQQWIESGRTIAYAGSVGRLHYGEQGDKGGLIWDIDANASTASPFNTPARSTIDIEFAGVPDMQVLADRAGEARGAHVRIRWSVDAEHASAVDRNAVAMLFKASADVKLEARVNPILRSRTQGVTRLPTLPQKLAAWAEATNTPTQGLMDRLQRLQSEPPEAIIDSLINVGASPEPAAPLAENKLEAAA
jgi:exonuclease SbcD